MIPLDEGGSPLRPRTPTRLQFQTTECGIGVLRMMLAYFGRDVEAEEVRRVTGVSRDCMNAGDIARGARHYGLTCRALRKEPEQLPKLGYPIVVHLRFIHFAVLEGMDGRYVHLNDPSAGRIDIPFEKFCEDFTGVALKFAPGPAFRRDPIGSGRQEKRRRFEFHDWRLLFGGARHHAGSSAADLVRRARSVMD